MELMLQYRIQQIQITTQTLKQLRSQLSLVLQFGFLYNPSGKGNLDPLNRSTLKDIETYFKLQDCKQEELIIQINNLVISNNGQNLSNGEKQILNFLRVLLMKRDIFCQEEATSNMDPKTEKLLPKLLWKYAQNKTLLVIAHRLENIHQYDQIVVLDSGEIVEVGKDLIKQENGYFNRLIKYHNKQVI